MQHFLFLQLPHGPFVTKLENELEAKGHRITRLLFNAGDWLFSRPECSMLYRGELQDFGNWLLHQHKTRKFTDILVYGDCRDIHRIAKDLSPELGCRFWVIEEGYLRPSWITLECDGANGNSHIPELFQHFTLSHGKPSDSHRITVQNNFGKTQRYIMLWAVLYYGCRLFFDLVFRQSVKSHRLNPFIYEFASWHIKLAKKLGGRDYRHRQLAKRFIQNEKYFFVPLQLVEDSQIEVHSDFNSIYEFIDQTLCSFSNYAHPDHKLLFKGHPLDSELINYRKYINKTAKRFGLENRVTYIHDGVVPNILDNAIGTVTVNSTVGIQSIHHRCPIICLGRSIYNHSGLTFSGSLDQFWINPCLPDRDKYEEFRDFLHKNYLIPGGFYRANSIEKLAPQLVERLITDREVISVSSTKEPVEKHAQQSIDELHQAELPLIKKIVLLPILLIPVITIPILSIPFFLAVVGIRLRIRCKSWFKTGLKKKKLPWSNRPES